MYKGESKGPESSGIFENFKSPITPEARQMLQSWRLSETAISDLQKTVGEYHGLYGNVVQKVAAIKSVYLETSRKTNATRIRIPHFYESLQKGIGGDCEMIASSLFAQLLDKNSLPKEELRTKDPLRFSIVNGHNPSHFQYGEHTWVGLSHRSDYFNEQMVVLDGAYQNISLIDVNGYRISSPPNYSYSPKEETSAFCTVTRLKYPSDRIHIIEPEDDVVLGLSQDNALSFGIGFAYDGTEIIPFLRAVCENGIDGAVYVANKKTDKIDLTIRRNPFVLSAKTDNEIIQVLEAISKIEVREFEVSPN